MDNIQDLAEAPQGQAQATEQVPVTGQVETENQPNVTEQPSNETSWEAIASKKGFKTPDDLAKAYVNLESQNKRVEMKAADLEKQFFPAEKPVEQKQAYTPQAEAEENAKALADLRQFVHSEAVEPLKKEFDQRLRTELSRLELRQTIKDNPDFSEYADSVKELKSRYPDMPWNEALTFSKAIKGDLASQAKAVGMAEGTKMAFKQAAAQVAQTKKVSDDTNVAPQDILKDAAKRWTIRPGMSPEAKMQIKKEQAFIERRLQEQAQSDRDFLAFSHFNR